MRIGVEPARRSGNCSEIYDKSLEEADLEVDHNGDVILTINASGVNCRKSRYRYRIRLSRHEVDRFGGAASTRKRPSSASDLPTDYPLSYNGGD
jgi:hypothetical protein